MSEQDRPYIGVDLGGTNMAAGVLAPDGRLLGLVRVKTKASQGADAVLERLGRIIRQSLEDANLHKDDVAGLGIGAPGTIDTRAGVVRTAVNLRWNNFPLGDRLKDQFDLPVVVDNDVNAGAWGEYRAGAGQGCSDLLAVFIGTGIGAGLILNGRLYHGHHRTAGEIGHTTVDADAPLGRRTLEDLASRTSVVNQLTQLILANHPSQLTEIVGGKLKKIRSKAIAQAVQAKDPLTLEVVEQAAQYVGVAIANVVTLLSLPRVVLGGGLTEALEETWVQAVRHSFEQHVFPPELRSCDIIAGKLLDTAGVVGAALLAREVLTRRASENL